MLDSKVKQVPAGTVITMWLHEYKAKGYDPNIPANALLAGILAEIQLPITHTKQFGNTVFVFQLAEDRCALFRAFNVDSPQNFIENSKKFVVWIKHAYNLEALVTEFKDRSILNLFKTISMRPPMPDMGYTVFATQDGGHHVVLNLGE